ncbi:MULTISPECIES: thioredoxin family protein [unclassified Beijerinckia]|uniref:thioredoxin family protein n=1 Tax=unclassified Beijerinckia TaxID=2638183 RepID=UPI00089C3139|nr:MULTISPECIES: thioredoxin family protein [unclassified Beijerinckia]MDH7798606.1 thioredoxin 1 [Beijerinckia sp. GAS462]SED26479.1 Thioredoxin [Beijerinckia sp. 28-YEA-48]
MIILSRRTALLSAACGLLATMVPAWATERQPYTEEAFLAAQKAGRSIVIEVHAPWCPICAKQKVVMKELEKKPEYDKLLIFMVDFDSQKDVLKKFRVTHQSTYISFTGTDEMQRSTGITDPMSLDALLQTAL